MKTNNEFELYIHIPFCVRKCLYCDFLSFPADGEHREKYIDALCGELYDIAENRAEGTLSTVFIGGGTPSSLDAGQISRVINCVRENFTLTNDAEITIECNPGTLSAEKLKEYKECGINRLSIGLQSANDEELKKLGRIHTYKDFLESYELAVMAGFTNINVDLMSAVPGQSIESYEDTLRKVCTLNNPPTHISAYSLIIEEGTPFFEMNEEGKLSLPDEDTEREMYHLTMRILEEYGYKRYEISNYAKPGFECRHNIGYWTGGTYYGAGLDAASYYDGCRFINTDDLIAYLKNPTKEPEMVERLSLEDKMSEYMILGLRMTKGVSVSESVERFGKSVSEVYFRQIEKLANEGLLIKDGDRLFLTEKGLDLANYCMRQFI